MTAALEGPGSEPVVSALRSTKPLHVIEKHFIFKSQERNPINEDKWRGKYCYRALRACGVRARKFYASRHNFISDALSHGVNIKWLAEYCGTSVAMIEKHYGRYIKSDSQGQLQRLFGTKTETLRTVTDDAMSKLIEAESEVFDPKDENEWK